MPRRELLQNPLIMPQTLRHTVAHLGCRDSHEGTRPPRGRGAAAHLQKLRAFVASVEIRLWAALVLLAVFGSLAFGASLALASPDLATWRLAVWFTGAAGAAWCLFIPTTVRLSGESWRRCVHIALLTMAAGEIVLISGAAVHLLLWLGGFAPAGAILHVLTVALSNVGMAAVFVVQFRSCGVPLWKPLVWWMLILNGAGAFFFAAGESLLLR